MANKPTPDLQALLDAATDKLKPCPFCGENGRPVFYEGRGVKCTRCKCWGPDPMQPMAQWNTRAPDLAKRVLELEADMEDVRDTADSVLSIFRLGMTPSDEIVLKFLDHISEVSSQTLKGGAS